MTLRTASYCAIVVALLFTGACSSDDASSPAQSAAIPIDSAPAAIADVYCSAIESCMGELYAVYTNNSDCRARMTQTFANATIPSWKSSIAKGTLVYHDDKVQTCLSALRAQGCALMDSRSPAICEDAVEGKVALDGDCTTHSECVGAAYCKPGAACPGKCAPREAANGPCLDNDSCQDGLVCAAGKCLAPIAAGGTCKDDSSTGKCSANLLCAGASKTTDGTCKTISQAFAAAENAPCDIAKGEFCAIGLVCAVTAIKPTVTAVCQKPFASGAACKVGVPNTCPKGEYCNADVSKGLIDGNCVPQPKAGEPCVALIGAPACATDLVCDIDGTCKAMQQNGAACVSSATCYSENCDNGTCSPAVDCK